MRQKTYFLKNFKKENRSYQFSLEENNESQLSLKISQKSGSDSKSTLTIPLQDINEFSTIMNEINITSKHTGAAGIEVMKSYSVEHLREKDPNAYKKWTPEEDDQLEVLFAEGVKVKEIAQILGRQRGAINSRIKKLELKELYRR